MSTTVVDSKVIGTEFVEVTRRHRQWASIPPEQRLTHEMIDTYADHRRAKLHALLDSEDHCIVASFFQADGVWAPCSRPTFGADRCASHGGPGAVASEVVRLRKENEELRARLAELQP